MNIEQIYADFTTHIAPKIAEGFVMTKEYFFDLFGRYVKFLIVKESIYVGICAVIFVASIVLFKWAVKNVTKLMEDDDNPIGFFGVAFGVAFGALGILISFSCGVASTFEIAQLVYVPEVAVYELIMDKNN